MQNRESGSGELFDPKMADVQHFELTPIQRVEWLQLIRSENVGPATFRDLINHFGTASNALDALPELSQRGGKKSIRICARERAQAELDASADAGVRIIGMGEDAYPQYLRHIDHPPPMLSVRGELDLNKHPPIGMVGARNASLSGIKLSGSFARDLAQRDFLVVSGFARGIDGAAHSASMATGTCAVMAGGVDVVFPPEHDALYGEMLENGNAFVSEMPLGFRPRAIDFPRRNRVIAGMSLGVIVIEAAKRSGSLITARLANECGRLVFAVPGSPLDPRSAGANHLLKSGAHLAASAEDVIEAIEPLLNKERVATTNKAAWSFEEEEVNSEDMLAETTQSDRERIAQALGPTPVDVDEIVRFTKLHVSQVQLVLLELRIAGRLERHSGNRVSLLM